jgi:anaerobic ribonucleoside-triphosphate reductase
MEEIYSLRIIKRDGSKVNFDKNKIKKAILKAFIDVDGEESPYAKEKARDIANYVSDLAEEHFKSDKEYLSVENIQDIVEEKLMASNRKDVAAKYVVYRHDRSIERERNTQMMNDIAEKISAKNVKNQNANVDEKSFGGRMGEANSTLMRNFALNNVISDMAKNNHLNNEIYIHDLDHYAVGDHNCLSIPFDKLLTNGFNTRQTDVRPAQSVSTAFQLIAVIFQLQSLQQFGGVSATHLDWTMAPYVNKSFVKHFQDGLKYIESLSEYKVNRFAKWFNNENKRIDDQEVKNDHPQVYEYAIEQTEKEINQAVEGMYHNLNTLQSRSGDQLPFTSINYGTCTEPEGRMVTKSLLETSIKGIGKLHKTSIFPCGIFQCMKGVNRKPEDLNYDLYSLALRSTAQRLYPNYANVDWSGNEGYDRNDPKTYFSTMGCRTANGFDINGFGQLKDGRGNVCPVTIIVPTLAMESQNVDDFMELLDKKIHEAKDMLLERFNWICSQDSDSAKFMYENGVMEGYVPKEGIRSALKHGTLAIGQIGLAETLQILIGCDHTTEQGMKLAKDIELLFKNRCSQFKEAYQLNFGVYYTPAENLCFTSMSKFKAKYGVIENVSDKDFFTNSIHVPVWKEMSPFEKIDIESQLTGYSSAGCITYVELDSSVKNNIEALETIVNYAMDKDIPYFAVNVPNDMCEECGYTDDIGEECPICKSKKIRRLRRVTGYLTGDYETSFNPGKQQETKMRVKHENHK